MSFSSLLLISLSLSLCVSLPGVASGKNGKMVSLLACAHMTRTGTSTSSFRGDRLTVWPAPEVTVREAVLGGGEEGEHT